MPGLARRYCPVCGDFRVRELRTYRWVGARDGVSGVCTELRCASCAAALFRELGTGSMTAEQHLVWRIERQLPRAVVRRRA